MSSIVADIRAGIESVVSTNLGATYQPLKFKFNIEKNNFRSNKKAYGVESGAGLRTSTITNAISMEQTFRITLVDEFKNVGLGDGEIQTKLDELNDKMIEIVRELHLSKAGVANVLNINFSDVEEPLILDDNEHVVALIFNVLVQYRQSTK